MDDLLTIATSKEKQNEANKFFSMLSGNIKGFAQKVLLADKTTPAPLYIIKLLMGSYIVQHDTVIHSKIYDNARSTYKVFNLSNGTDNYVSLLDSESFQSFLIDIISNAYEADGLTLFCGRFADDNTAKKLITSFNKAVQASLGSMVSPVYETSDVYFHRSAIILGESKTAAMFAEKQGIMHDYAKIHGKSTAQARLDLIDFGFDENDTKKYDLGNKIIEAVLCPDFTVSLTDTKTGKIVKSIPKRGADPVLYEKAAADFKSTKSMLKKAYQSCVRAVFNDFLNGTETSAEDWLKLFNSPLIKDISEMIVWIQGDSTFIMSPKGCTVDVFDNEYVIKEDVPIRVMHPIDIDSETAALWSEYCTKHTIRQPFEQVYEPVYPFTEIESDRYADFDIPYYRLNGKEAHGIRVVDRRFHNSMDMTMRDCTISFTHTKPKVSGLNPGEIYQVLTFKICDIHIDHPSRYANHIIYLLDKWTLAERILKDDPAIGSLLKNCTLPQILEYIDLATENNCVNATAVLLDYRNTHFSEYNGIDALDALLLLDDF